MAATSVPTEFSLSQHGHIDRRGPTRWIITHTLQYWYLWISMIVGAFGNAGLAAVLPMLIGQAINVIDQPQPDFSSLLRIAILIAISQIIRSVLQLGRNFSAELLGQRMERDIRDELYVSLLGKSMTFHNLQPVGDTMARATNDVREINLMFSPGINLVIGSATFLIVPMIIAPQMYPSLILVPLLYTIAYGLALWQYLHELGPITSKVRTTFGETNTRLAEAIDGIETVKGMSQEETEVERFDVNAQRYRNAFVHQGDVEARFLPLLLLAIAIAGGLLQALNLYREGLIDIGQVVAYFGLLQLFGFPTFVSLFAYSQVSLGIAGANRILDLINRENDLDQNTEGYAHTIKGEIEFKDVTFSYREEETALENITFKIKPGQTVAIVGQTGAGKTSLVKLVNRTYDVSAGEILVDGINVRDWNLEALRRQISIIEQDIFLFSRSIAENIAFGQQDATCERIEWAATAAQATEFLSSFKDGYDTVIGERGITLSGGQRQRLALARAFLTDPPILILDDSTSAIDSATEDKIQRAIFAASRDRTTLIITHRLSQIRWADLIVVLKNGRISETGTHDQLMQSSSAYRSIFSQ